MFRTRHWRQRIAWMAFLAMLVAALMPSMSHATPGERLEAAMLAEICSATGMLPAGQDQHSSHAGAGHMDDCPYCRVHADVPVLPQAAFVIDPVAIIALRPSLFYQSPFPLFTWVASAPRGPPLLA